MDFECGPVKNGPNSFNNSIVLYTFALIFRLRFLIKVVTSAVNFTVYMIVSYIIIGIFSRSFH